MIYVRFLALLLGAVALVSALRTPGRTWRKSGTPRRAWIVAIVLSMFLPGASHWAIEVVRLVPAIAYFAFVRRSLLRISVQEDERHRRTISSLAEEYRGRRGSE